MGPWFHGQSLILELELLVLNTLRHIVTAVKKSRTMVLILFSKQSFERVV